MRPLSDIRSPAWARAPLSQVLRLGEHTAAYVAPPRMALVQAGTQFGRLEHRQGPLALLVTVMFQNDRAQHIWLRSLDVKYGGTWYHPIQFLGDRVHLWYAHGRHDLALPRTQSLIAAPYIPAAAAVERGALFRLPESWDRWPTHLRVTAKATFIHRRARRLVVTLTNPS
jgi:hypothetical protein